jgi:hypothetical protein
MLTVAIMALVSFLGVNVLCLLVDNSASPP